LTLTRWQLDRVARTLSSGGVIAYPTESVFGLGCDPDNDQALQRILKIKSRPAHKGLIILVSDMSQAIPYIKPLTPAQLTQIQSPQSRATTWLVERRSDVSPLLCGRFDALAVRVTQHPIARAICHFTDKALVSTSCNRAGKPEITSTAGVRNHMVTDLDLIVDGQCGGERPSRIIDLMTGRVIRD